jgi:hypothetical protein
LNNLEVHNPSAPNIDHIEEVRRSISSMVPTAIDLNDSLWVHPLAIFSRDLPGEGEDSGHDPYLSLVDCHWREGNEPGV